MFQSMKWHDFTKYKPTDTSKEYLVCNEKYVWLVYLNKDGKFVERDTTCCEYDTDVTDDILFWLQIQNPCQMELF